MVSLDVDVSVECATCGKILAFDDRRNNTIHVEPCENCNEELRRFAKDEGYDLGMTNAVENISLIVSELGNAERMSLAVETFESLGIEWNQKME